RGLRAPVVGARDGAEGRAPDAGGDRGLRRRAQHPPCVRGVDGSVPLGGRAARRLDRRREGRRRLPVARIDPADWTSGAGLPAGLVRRFRSGRPEASMTREIMAMFFGAFLAYAASFAMRSPSAKAGGEKGSRCPVRTGTRP